MKRKIGNQGFARYGLKGHTVFSGRTYRGGRRN